MIWRIKVFILQPKNLQKKYKICRFTRDFIRKYKWVLDLFFVTISLFNNIVISKIM